MKYEEVKNIVANATIGKFKVTFENGRTANFRLFLDIYGRVGVLDKKKKVYGHVLFSSYSRTNEDYRHWVSLEEVKTKPTDKFSLFMKRARKAVEMLDGSGLWEDINKEIKHFLSLDEDKQREMVNDILTDSYNNFYLKTDGNGKYNWVHTYQIFCGFARKRCWKSIAWSKYRRTQYENDVRQAIANKTNFTRNWANGYDNSLEICLGEDGKLRAWYSEEFRGCGNGHYYLLFDATHAIFYEDD